MKSVVLNKNKYIVLEDEFRNSYHDEYNNLILFPRLGVLERDIGLISDLADDLKLDKIFYYGIYNGGFVALNCSKKFTKNVVINHNNYNLNIVRSNFIEQFKNNDFGFSYFEKINNFQVSDIKNSIVYLEEDIQDKKLLEEFLSNNPDCIVYGPPGINGYKYSYTLTKIPEYYHSSQTPPKDRERVLYIPEKFNQTFLQNFHYYILPTGKFHYDNLVHFTMIVKDAGPLFEKVLQNNLHNIDRWTILDTGSTDGTQEVIKRVLACKKGRLYEEPFVNFRESRNRCLDLAGKNCKYNMMLDDTYVVEGKLRNFLNTIRSDQFADSYSLIIRSDDVEYSSNRITKSANGLRYIFKIHEVIQQENNVNVIIPKTDSTINDYRADYMEKRTMNRKLYDLKLLFEMMEEEPNNPRHLYYIAQTYNLLNDYENTYKYFELRANSPLEGFVQEKVDSLFEMARIANFKFNWPWEKCEQLYMNAYNADPSRPEPFYFIGINYYLQGDRKKAYHYLKQGYEIGYPLHAQFSLKPTLSFHFLPKFLTELCYDFEDYKTGLECSDLFLQYNKPSDDGWENVKSWNTLFKCLSIMPKRSETPIEPIDKLVVFVADGGFTQWTGSDIEKRGMGGSETYVIETARYLAKIPGLKVLVYCNCNQPEVYDGVQYIPLIEFYNLAATTRIHTCIVSRYNEYIPVALKGWAENVYFILHDLGGTCNIIPTPDNFKGVFCLTEWHKDYFLQTFPNLRDKTWALHYGLDHKKFFYDATKKIKNRFIYSSYPNRGLSTILELWPEIIKILPDAVLEIFSDVENNWANTHHKDNMTLVKSLLESRFKDCRGSIIYHGWVDKDTLAEGWRRASYWLYPCRFIETFCLTALEAAATRTLPITNDLGSLIETVGDRGVIIPGNSETSEWKNKLLETLKNLGDYSELLEKNYKWSLERTWEKRANYFYDNFIKPNIKESKLVDNNIQDPTLQLFVNPILNYYNMYNWTNDLPRGTRQIFENILSLLNDKPGTKNILEIGTFAGTSLIEIMRNVKNSKATVIDKWENYTEFQTEELKTIKESEVERGFFNNIKKSGLENDVKVLKGDSQEKLLELIKSSSIGFDFIYVDGSHKCVDVYVDLFLSWKLLNKGGILAIDDYLFRFDRATSVEDILNIPLKGIDHFLDRYKNQYKILDKGYRVFLEKI